MTASHVIYEGPDYKPVILVVTVLVGVTALFALLALYDQAGKVRHRARMRKRIEAWAALAAPKAGPAKGRHSGPQPAVDWDAPDYVPPAGRPAGTRRDTGDRA